MLLLPPRTGR